MIGFVRDKRTGEEDDRQQKCRAKTGENTPAQGYRFRALLYPVCHILRTGRELYQMRQNS